MLNNDEINHIVNDEPINHGNIQTDFLINNYSISENAKKQIPHLKKKLNKFNNFIL